MGYFNLPPGVRVGDLPGYSEGTCLVCYKACDECVCPECPRCGEQGNIMCYENDKRGRANGKRHAMRINKAQLVARTEAYLAALHAKTREVVEELKAMKEATDPFHPGSVLDGEPFMVWNDTIGDSYDPDTLQLTWS